MSCKRITANLSPGMKVMKLMNISRKGVYVELGIASARAQDSKSERPEHCRSKHKTLEEKDCMKVFVP